MRWGTTIVDQHRSYPDGPPAVRVDDIDQLHAAARELEAVAMHEQARHLAEVHAVLAELYRRDGVQITDAELDAQANYLALLERGERFLQDVATRLHPGSKLLEFGPPGGRSRSWGVAGGRRQPGRRLPAVAGASVVAGGGGAARRTAQPRPPGAKRGPARRRAPPLQPDRAMVAPQPGRRPARPARRVPPAAGAIGTAACPPGRQAAGDRQHRARQGSLDQASPRGPGSWRGCRAGARRAGAAPRRRAGGCPIGVAARRRGRRAAGCGS
jgi:hypothetical protein